MKKFLDAFVSQKTGMIVDDLPPLIFFAHAHATLKVDDEVHAIAVMRCLWRGKNVLAANIQLLQLEGPIDIRYLLLQLFLVGDMRPRARTADLLIWAKIHRHTPYL